jgi:dienelactone hydrolase
VNKPAALFSSAAALLALAASAPAQPPPGITPEMIATALPEEGAPLADPGPYPVTAESAAPGLRVYRPASLDTFPSRDTLPVVVWGNGGCAVDGTRYGGFLSTIASHGFVVLTTAAVNRGSQGATPPPAGTPPPRATADDLRAGIDWAEQENKRAGSPLAGKIATDKVAVMGQSCGGFLSIALGADPRVDTIGVFNSGVQAPAAGAAPSANRPDQGALKSLHGPVLLINGAERDFMTAASKSTFDAINGLPAFYGARHGAGHTATVFHPGGGEYANVASSWLLWQLKGDKKAGAMFAGKSCSLCTNSNWDVAAKGLE